MPNETANVTNLSKQDVKQEAPRRSPLAGLTQDDFEQTGPELEKAAEACRTVAESCFRSGVHPELFRRRVRLWARAVTLF